MAEHTGDKLFDYVTRVLERIYPGIHARHDIFDDLRQECILDILTAYHTFDPRRSTRTTWYYNRIKCTARHFFRRQRRLTARERPLVADIAQLLPLDTLVIASTVLDTLAQLGEPGYLFYLHVYEGYSIRTLAELTHTSYTRMVRQLRSVRRALIQACALDS